MGRRLPKSNKLETWKTRLELAEKAWALIEKMWPVLKRISGTIITITPWVISWLMDNR